MTEPTSFFWNRERWARFERARQSRRAVMRWRWIVAALGGLLAAALLVRGNLVIGGLLAALVGARAVLLARLTRLWNARTGGRSGVTA